MTRFLLWLFVSAYAFGAFIEWEFNPALWGDELRAVIAMFTLLLVFFRWALTPHRRVTP